jgi:hypothetical protein
LDRRLASARRNVSPRACDLSERPTPAARHAIRAADESSERTASALFYTHLSARQAPYHTVAIPPSGEEVAYAQQYRASGLALVTAAMPLEHRVGRALDDLRCGGEIIADPLLSHLSPVGWQHIDLTGDYLWDADSGLGPDGFRSLRTTTRNLRPALAV